MYTAQKTSSKWNTNAFSVYTKETDRIDEASAHLAVVSVLRFLSRMGILKYHCHSGYIASTIKEDNLRSVQSDMAGVFKRLEQPGDEVSSGNRQNRTGMDCSMPVPLFMYAVKELYVGFI